MDCREFSRTIMNDKKAVDLVSTWAYDEITVVTEKPENATEIVPGFREDRE